MSGRIRNGFLDEIPEAYIREPDELTAPPSTPDTKMLSAAELAEIRKAARLAGLTRISSWALLDHIEALTARVAELERRAAELAQMVDLADASRVEQIRRADRLESELAAARAPVEESEIAAAQRNMHEACLCAYDSRAEDDPCVPCRVSRLITRLARERDEARAKALEAEECMEVRLHAARTGNEAERQLATSCWWMALHDVRRIFGFEQKDPTPQ